MDKRLEVTEALREGLSADAGNTPPVTMVWRAMRAEHRRHAEELRGRDGEYQKMLSFLAEQREEIHRLRTVLDSPLAAASECAEFRSKLSDTINIIEQSFAKLGFELVAPTGQPFEGELLDLLENVAQQPLPELDGPRVDKVIAPAILFRSTLVRMGKAVIAVPARTDGQ